MKKIILLIISVLFATTSFGQQEEPEVVFTGPGKLVKLDGTILEGWVTYSFVNSLKVRIKTSDEESQKISRKELKEFVINDTLFEKINTGGLAIGNSDEFAILLTPVDSKIKIYETINQGRVGTTSEGKGVFPTTREYVAFFPDKKPKSLNDLFFSPFHKKVSALVKDCKDLSEKISNKEEGYKVGFTTLPDQKLKIFLRVAEEYTKCGN